MVFDPIAIPPPNVTGWSSLSQDGHPHTREGFAKCVGGKPGRVDDRDVVASELKKKEKLN